MGSVEYALNVVTYPQIHHPPTGSLIPAYDLKSEVLEASMLTDPSEMKCEYDMWLDRFD
jgi:hypothetical protein